MTTILNCIALAACYLGFTIILSMAIGGGERNYQAEDDGA